jgi:hypothetical protein
MLIDACSHPPKIAQDEKLKSHRIIITLKNNFWSIRNALCYQQKVERQEENLSSLPFRSFTSAKLQQDPPRAHLNSFFGNK